MPGYIDSDEFLADFSRKERRAFDAFFDTYWVRMFNYAYKLTDNEGEAKDITSHAFAKLFAWKEAFSSLPNIATFLYTIIKNDSFNAIEKRRRTSNREQKYAALHVSTIIDDEGLRYEKISERIIAALYDAIQALPRDTGQVITLLYLQGKTYSQTAETLGISPETVKKRRNVALKLLRKTIVSGEYHMITALIMYVTAVSFFYQYLSLLHYYIIGNHR